jgi:hypothetical protein
MGAAAWEAEVSTDVLRRSSQYASLVGGIGDWLGRIMIGLGAVLLAAVVGILAIALVVLFMDAVT